MLAKTLLLLLSLSTSVLTQFVDRNCDCPTSNNNHVEKYNNAQKSCHNLNQNNPGFTSCLAFNLGLISKDSRAVNLDAINEFVGDVELQASSCSVENVKLASILSNAGTWIWPGDFDYKNLDKELTKLLNCIFDKADQCTADPYRRTVIIIKKETVPGQDLFILGGKADGGSIDIKMIPMGNQWEKYNAWSNGDTKLDWNGAQTEQGKFNNWNAMGTPAAWTTDEKNSDFYYGLTDGLGSHQWVMNCEMDCSQTDNGFFEFSVIYSHGGEGGEPEINQEDKCFSAEDDPPKSKHHVAKCGQVNMFEYGTGSCKTINSLCKH